jgi:hypothetical protein
MRKTAVRKPAVDCFSPTVCPTLDCFHVGEDKGTFAQGRGYTSYHKVARLVCMTRHLHGCPIAAVCADPACRMATGPADPPDKCTRCGGPVEKEEK